MLFLHNWPTADPAPAGGGWRVVSVPLLAVLHTAFVAERAFKQLVNNDAAMASLELGTLALQTKAGQKVMFLLDGGLFASSAGGSRAAEVSTHTCTHPIARRAIRSTLCELAIRSPKTAERLSHTLLHLRRVFISTTRPTGIEVCFRSAPQRLVAAGLAGGHAFVGQLQQRLADLAHGRAVPFAHQYRPMVSGSASSYNAAGELARQVRHCLCLVFHRLRG